MAEMLDESEVDWLEGLEEELMMQDLLFGAEQLPLLAPQRTAAESEPEVRSEALVNMLVSKVYSGPTIGDIESALNLSCSSGGRHFRSGLPEKGSGSRTDNKHTLRIKTIVNGVADDGYKWRKYGQKLIKNSQNPRSYYRCTNPRCNAKKQVERSTEDPETVIVTYEGLHLHYTYSHLLLSQKSDKHAATLNAAKKPRIEPELQDRGSERSLQKRERPQQKKSLRAGESHQEYFLEDILLENAPAREKSIQNRSLADVQRRQGMLEDVVPLMVRKPSNEPHYSSRDSSPSHYSSLFLSPSSSQIDAGILSGIL